MIAMRAGALFSCLKTVQFGHVWATNFFPPTVAEVCAASGRKEEETMSKAYNPEEIELKWQKKWEDAHLSLIHI